MENYQVELTVGGKSLAEVKIHKVPGDCTTTITICDCYDDTQLADTNSLKINHYCP